MSSPSISALTAGNSFSATQQARTNTLMKPRRTPLCFFSKASRYSARRAITADMSTSLKVVSIAAVFWASFNRSAMVRRRRVILTRCSRGSSGRAGAGGRGAGGSGAGRFRNASTSPLVIRPSLPDPGPIAAGASCCSSISRAAAGRGSWMGWTGGRGTTGGAAATGAAGRVTGPSGRGGGLIPAGGFAAGRATGAAGAAADGGVATGAAATEAAAGWGAAETASPSSTPSNAPTSTSLPSGKLIAVSTPAVGDETSTVTLSVSSSTSGSSAATVSPGCFIQRAIVAVVTLSPRAGTLISVGIGRFLNPVPEQL